MKILITEGDVVGNKGAVAMVKCIIHGIKNEFPDSDITITSKFIKKEFYEFDDYGKVKIIYDNEQAFDFPLIKLWVYWLFKMLKINLDFLLKDKVLNTYLSQDLVISASGISFHDNYGPIKIYHFSKYLQIPLLLGKRVIKFTQSIGPFSTLFNKKIAQLTLKNIDLIMARGINSKENLDLINVQTNVKVFPDIAMTLEPQKSSINKKVIESIKNTKEYEFIIGFSPNIVCKNLDKRNIYVKALIELFKYILNKYPKTAVLFIPHTISKKNLGVNDDYSICKEIMNKLDKNGNLFLVDTLNFSPEETKWLISECDFFIGSRFHSLIASVSSCVPSIAIGWHWKYEEMMNWVGLKKNIIQYWEINENNLIKLFDENIQLIEQTKSHLRKVVPKINQKAYEAIKIINEFLHEENKKNNR